MYLRSAKYYVLMAGLAAFVYAAEPAAILLDVPVIKQEKNGCGAACIAMVVQYWANRIPSIDPADSQQDSILKLLYSKEAKGIYASDMESYFEERGFRTFAFGAEWPDLQTHISKGRPLIVSWDVSGGDGDRLHYVVVTGISSDNSMVWINDPAKGKLQKLSHVDFDRKWKPMKRWTLLAVPEHAG